VDIGVRNVIPKEPRRFIRLKELTHIVGYSRSTIYSHIRTGQFPKPYPLGSRSIAWFSDEIEAWMESRIEARQALDERTLPKVKTRNPIA